MKVLHFYKTYFPETMGGLEQSINQIARGTANLGVNPEVLTLSPNIDNDSVRVDGHLVHRCRSTFEIASTPFSFVALTKFYQLARKADLVHYHYPYPFSDLLHLVSRVKKPTLLTYHSDIVKQKRLLKLYGPLKHYFLNSVNHIVVTSPNYQASSPVLARLKYKSSVIPLGLDKGTYPRPCAEKLKHWRKKFGVRFFLFIGVLRYYKGLHILIEAARDSDYPIVIIGTGPVEAELKAQAAKLGVHNIYFLGFLPDEDKVALLELCYALIFPSHLRSEAFGISLLEGAMYGKPLISCEIGTGTSYININKLTGVVVPPSDSIALRHAMDYLWVSPREAATMGAFAQTRYQELFTAEKMAESYVKLYKNLLNPGR